MKAWIVRNWMVVALGVVTLIALVLGVRSCHHAQPVHVSPVPPESVQVVVHDTTHSVHVVVNRDSLIALERKVQALTDEKESWSVQSETLLQQLVQIDSQWAARFDSMAGMVAVQYRRGRLDIVQYQAPKYVRVSSSGTWRSTWTLAAKPGGGISIATRKLPIDFGVEAAGDFWTPPTALSPSGLASLCLTARTSRAWQWRLGAGWLLGSGPVIVAGAKLAWIF